jgi:hypothetical protein
MKDLLCTANRQDSEMEKNRANPGRSAPLARTGRGVGGEEDCDAWIRPSSANQMARARLVFLLICLLLTPLLCAQETASPEPAKGPASPEPAKEPQPPAPIFGMDTTGTLDVGYRWNVGLRGSEDLYRSLVNLGEGPRLLGANLTMNSPLGAGKYVDRLQLNASAWGGDPYNTLRCLPRSPARTSFRSTIAT